MTEGNEIQHDGQINHVYVYVYVVLALTLPIKSLLLDRILISICLMSAMKYILSEDNASQHKSTSRDS